MVRTGADRAKDAWNNWFLLGDWGSIDAGILPKMGRRFIRPQDQHPPPLKSWQPRSNRLGKTPKPGGPTMRGSDEAREGEAVEEGVHGGRQRFGGRGGVGRERRPLRRCGGPHRWRWKPLIVYAYIYSPTRHEINILAGSTDSEECVFEREPRAGGDVKDITECHAVVDREPHKGAVLWVRWPQSRGRGGKERRQPHKRRAAPRVGAVSEMEGAQVREGRGDTEGGDIWLGGGAQGHCWVKCVKLKFTNIRGGRGELDARGWRLNNEGLEPVECALREEPRAEWGEDVAVAGDAQGVQAEDGVGGGHGHREGDIIGGPHFPSTGLGIESHVRERGTAVEERGPGWECPEAIDRDVDGGEARGCPCENGHLFWGEMTEVKGVAVGDNAGEVGEEGEEGYREDGREVQLGVGQRGDVETVDVGRYSRRGFYQLAKGREVAGSDPYGAEEAMPAPGKKRGGDQGTGTQTMRVIMQFIDNLVHQLLRGETHTILKHFNKSATATMLPAPSRRFDTTLSEVLQCDFDSGASTTGLVLLPLVLLRVDLNHMTFLRWVTTRETIHWRFLHPKNLDSRL
ncbi:hypothetical protein B0H16DRAFT_1801218 [Mycena metata]|uniref:Uncharacterized protein n=1 Tax=Mycena metata TaxID=1033252 RepID=A0AAD7JJK0_9AGAR|nr:hypothetical protein B0H16DRAFT_1801218 [Mycena metata]